MPNDLISTREATALLGYAYPSSLSRMVAAGLIEPAMKLEGKTGAFLFRRTDVEALRAEQVAS